MKVIYIWLPGWSFDGEVFQPLRGLLPDPAADLTVDYTEAQDAGQFYASAVACIEAARSSQSDADTSLIAIGWSLGGMLALRLAAEKLVDGAVVISAGARFVRSSQPGSAYRSGWDARQLKRMRAALAADRAGVETQFRSRVLDGSQDETSDSLLALDGQRFASRWSDTSLDAGLEWLMNEDLHSLLPNIACPLLLIHGAEDSICPADASASLLPLVQHADRLLLEGTGHMPFLAEPALVSMRIRRWLHDQLP